MVARPRGTDTAQVMKGYVRRSLDKEKNVHLQQQRKLYFQQILGI